MPLSYPMQPIGTAGAFGLTEPTNGMIFGEQVKTFRKTPDLAEARRTDYNSVMPDLKQERLYMRVARKIRRRIIAKEYIVGERLPTERILAESLGVARSTAREAIIVLEVHGLVEVRSGSGAYVVSSEPSGVTKFEEDVELFQILEARRAIETETCALAARRANEMKISQIKDLLNKMNGFRASSLDENVVTEYKFHMAIANASENSALSAMTDSLWQSQIRSPQFSQKQKEFLARNKADRNNEYHDILFALIHREENAARSAMYRHISRVLSDLLDLANEREVEQARVRALEMRRRFAMNG